MISLTFSLLSLIAFSLAQNQTASLYLPFLDGELVGSIAGGVRNFGPHSLNTFELTTNQ